MNPFSRIVLIIAFMTLAAGGVVTALAQEGVITDGTATPVLAPAATVTTVPAASVMVAEPVVVEVVPYNPRDYIPLSAILADGSIQVTDAVLSQSLLFTPEDIKTVIATLNRRARSGQAGVGANDGQILVPGQTAGNDPAVAKPYYPPIPTKRTISVSGMVYRTSNDWIVWLNGHKLVPGSRLPEIVEMRVESDRVHLKWFDIGMGKILSITLRPRQTYDITSGVLLTSSGGDVQ